MSDFVKQYVGVLIDRICELSIENTILKQMAAVPAGPQWPQILETALRSPESFSKRKQFAERRDAVLATLEQEEAVEAMLKLPTHGLPN
jgi:hypothetical protein